MEEIERNLAVLQIFSVERIVLREQIIHTEGGLSLADRDGALGECRTERLSGAVECPQG